MDSAMISVSPCPSTACMSVDRTCSRTPPAPASRKLVDVDLVRGCMTPEMSVSGNFRSATPVSSYNCWTPGPGSECTEAESHAEGELCCIGEEGVVECLADVISDLLENLAASTEAAVPSVFCAVPAMGLRDFVARVAKYSNFTVAPFVASVMLIDRLDAKGFAHLIHNHSIQLVFLTALCVAAKAVEEFQLPNSIMAAIGGITTAHLKACEMDFVTFLDWELGINEEAFGEYMHFLTCKAGVPVERMGNIGFLGQ